MFLNESLDAEGEIARTRSPQEKRPGEYCMDIIEGGPWNDEVNQFFVLAACELPNEEPTDMMTT